MRDAGGGAGRMVGAGGLSLITASLVTLASVTAFAQKLTVDPMRPPAGIGAGVANGERDAGGGMRLQTVVISPTQRAAIISGVMVKLGEKYGDAVLVRVAESEVVLKRGSVEQVLRIHPDVDMRGGGKARP